MVVIHIVRDGGLPRKRRKRDVLVDQVIDSAVVAGIVFFTELATGGPNETTIWRAAIAFGLTFCIKLKDYRGIS
ncbi:MAG: hypothetical protein ACE5Z5_14370 [Candidatus Bathyarchaeia archaeon]